MIPNSFTTKPKILLSSEDKEFDPDSMVEEEDQDPGEERGVVKETEAPSPGTSPAMVILTLQTPEEGEEPFQVMGFLRRVQTVNGALNISFDCLTSFGLELCELALANEITKFVSCEFKLPGPSSQIWEIPNWELKSSELSEIQGMKAMAQLTFQRKAEPKGP